jgi:hypothetical protein
MTSPQHSTQNSPQNSPQNSTQHSTQSTAQRRLRIAAALLLPLGLVRQLLAYYANWRVASRMFDEEIER